MLLYLTNQGPVLDADGTWVAIDRDFGELLNDPGLHGFLKDAARGAAGDPALSEAAARPRAPIAYQEVWAAGVTYYRSRTARMEEAEEAGGGGFYDRVYAADRPELFLKATRHRVVGPGDAMRLRSDSEWIVPEPELTLVVTSGGSIVGYTVGNDLSCRDIEGENPLYLPQAKTFDRCAAIGPAILVTDEPPGPDTRISVTIRRDGQSVFEGDTTLAQMKRTPEELVGFLFRENPHPAGALLMTGTGIVPPDEFSLRRGDETVITIDGIGTLANVME